ncbi:protein of unknown function UPF0157 [Desulfarculus baarsii DSM 2075]|uniref:GrpB family protein n=1 Tax=Desulfarculus baarsii (strain ATCC 33931 / DSM 2075 / LMG 7858 / VKM B-1802 / 2st14) TaxID=644282 RepID=E1QDH8_DESB2|nr:GrpB family protein [Desulfarculus baarsii]ADK83497.1 protein of unknown function UPF0157 [Desulfarculus baarsii DSM 2075]
MDEQLRQKIARVVAEPVEIVDPDPRWPALFAREKAHLLACLPDGAIDRLSHCGSTAVPGLPAKPIIDILALTPGPASARDVVAPILEAQGYDYFWRPSFGDDTPPYYAWFIKRDAAGRRTHHIHLIEAHFPQWDWLLARDYLRENPAEAKRYARLKLTLAKRYAADRIAYTKAKAAFLGALTAKAKAAAGL